MDLKFVVMSYPRTGSTLLLSSLGKHTNINQGMEVFNGTIDGDVNWAVWRRKKFKELYGTSHLKLIDDIFLDEQFYDFSVFLDEIFKKYNGIKIIYNQLRTDSITWNNLSLINDLKIIYMKRNVVDAAVSLKTAKKSKVWQRWTKNQNIPDEIRESFDPNYFQWFYDEYCCHEDRIRKLLSNNKSITINYEDMITNWDNVMGDVQKFLEVKKEDLQKTLFKRSAHRVEWIVNNYLDIKKHYSGTHLEKFFKDHKIIL